MEAADLELWKGQMFAREKNWFLTSVSDAPNGRIGQNSGNCLRRLATQGGRIRAIAVVSSSTNC